ncbi:hypothetical protein EV192_106629 [Actinocrispum wychmicini]|uniref:Uncharacterized protein n=1 Tax=Actinocrispum wychmicini TaxID=1213861 RepID=A0A4R2JFX3_9PSEU|nr:hypothetical protein EV192_106629 [Actinocrispum wychmicini]
MASDPRNERRGNRPLEVRMPLEFKARLQATTHNAGTDPSKITKQLLAWWLREPGAELPPRPERES